MLPLKDDQPRYSTPYVNTALIVVNVVVFLLQFAQMVTDPQGADQLLRTYGEIPAHLASFLGGSHRYTPGDIILPFFTSMFLHGSWMHVIFNMWGLYIFGDNVEDYLGHFTYLIFYLLVGLLAMATQVAIYPHSSVPTIGASGAIAGVMGAYFILYPHARVLTWIFELLILVVWIPAWVILGYWFVLNLLSGTERATALHRQNMGGVAFWAHVGGFIAGMVMIKIFPERARRSPYAWR